jgi:hypothetical protein
VRGRKPELATDRNPVHTIISAPGWLTKLPSRNYACLAVCSRFPKSPTLGRRTFFSACAAVTSFHFQRTIAAKRVCLASTMRAWPGILTGTPNGQYKPNRGILDFAARM